MDRQSTLLLALGLLIAAAAFVSASGCVLFVRDRRAARALRAPQHHEAAEEHQLPELLDLRDRRERLELRHLEIDPHVSDAVRGIVQRVRDEGGA